MLVVIPLGLVAVASALALARWPVSWAQALVWILVLQNITVIGIWKLTGSAEVARDLLYAKEAMIAGGAVVAAVAVIRAILSRRVPPVLWLAIAFGAVCLLWVPLSYARHEGLEQIARGLRSLVFPTLLLVIGTTLVTGPRAGTRLRRTLWWAGILLGASVIVERSFVPPQAWLAIGLDRYWVDVKGESLDMLNGGLPWNFFVVLFGDTVRRGFGIMTDPLALSYFLILPLALAVAEIWRRADRPLPRLPVAAALLCSIGITFSLSRLPMAMAAALIVLIPLVALGLVHRRYREAASYAALSAVAFGLVVGLSLASTPRIGPADLAAEHPLGQGSEGAHVESVLRARDWGPLITGRGLGTAGYLSAKFAEAPTDIGYENVYLDTAAQVSMVGALLLLAILVTTSVMLLRARGPSAWLAVPTGGTLTMLAVAGMLSGQLEVLTSLGTTWLFSGVMLAAVRAEAQEPERAAAAFMPDAKGALQPRS